MLFWRWRNLKPPVHVRAWLSPAALSSGTRMIRIFSAVCRKWTLFWVLPACDRIVSAVENDGSDPFSLFPSPDDRPVDVPVADRELLYEKSAYIKVSEGCSRHCTYCIIPNLRGRQRSRPVELICEEAAKLLGQGVKEVILTAENTTDYGLDQDGPNLHTVLEKLRKLWLKRCFRLAEIFVYPSQYP